MSANPCYPFRHPFYPGCPTTMTHKKKRKVVWLILLCGFIGIQFIQPHIDHPAVTADIDVPPAVKAVLRKACYDCHSNETRFAWFDKITPANWLVASHIREGRRLLNFSQWDSISKDQQNAKLFECLNQMAFNRMPIPQYTLLHPEAKLSPADITVLQDYLAGQFITGKPDSSKTAAAIQQFNAWLQSPVTMSVKPSPNGISFWPEYKDWQAISTTQRLDNGTMRVITGNDVAIKAIREQQINPWPDGTVFAKIAWDEQTDAAGNIVPGAFKQVEFMIKDKHKYADTDGWGWARWKGMQLQPYGKNAMFTMECTGCHRPMRDNDFVFTRPINLSTK
jgi:Haem-binding domain/Cytochrome P460